MVEGTNESNFFVYRGGYYGDQIGCRHRINGVPTESVPRELRERIAAKINVQEYERLKKDENYTDVEFNEQTGGLKAIHIDHQFDKIRGHYEKDAQNILFENGYKTILSSEKGFESKHFEGYINGFKNEIKTILGNSPITIAKRINQSIEKGAEVCTIYFPNGNAEELLPKALQYFTGTLPKLIIIDGDKIKRNDIK